MTSRRSRPGRFLTCAAALAAAALCLAARPAAAQREISAEVYLDKALGMWMGELIGNYAGRPCEGSIAGGGLDYQVDWTAVLGTSTWLGDDDTCFEYLYAGLLSQDAAPAAAQIRQAWVDNIPASSVYIANRQARYLMDAPPTGLSLSPPQTGSFQYNVHATAIDSQITTESLGALAPGLRQRAADLCGTFAGVSNEGFSVHAAQFYAAMYASAAFESDVPTVIDMALDVVPTTSRTYEVIEAVVTFHQNDPDDWRACQTMLHDAYGAGSTNGRYRGWTESAINVGLTTMALLYGEGDFQQTVEIGVLGGYDADCNPATAAGLLGMIKGYQGVGGSGGGILAELPAAPAGTAYDVRCLTAVGSLTTAPAVADTLAAAAELQIVAAGGSVTGEGSQQMYTLPDDVVSAPPELPNPSGPAGLVGRVQATGHAVSVSASVYRNVPGVDRNNILSIIDGITDYRYNGYRPYYTNDGANAQPAGGDWYQLTFPREMTFNEVAFYEGDIVYSGGPNSNPRLVLPYGGFFTDLTVEVLRDGQWREVTGLAFSEPLDANQYYQTIAMTFDAASGSAVRIRGTAGGSQEYTTIVELEAYGAMGVAGDCDEDGVLKYDDLAALAAGINSGAGDQWAEGDFNFDGKVNAADYIAMKRSFLAAGGPAGGAAPIPEPASLTLLACAAGVILRRKHSSSAQRAETRPRQGTVQPRAKPWASGTDRT